MTATHKFPLPTVSFRLTSSALNRQQMGTGYLTRRSNKRAITLNLKHEKGREILKPLVAGADVLVENLER